MNNEFKEAYETINISSDVKNRIKGEIMNEHKTTRKVFRFGKPFAVAAVIVALVVPTGVFATQQVMKHYKMKMTKGNHKVEFNLSDVQVTKEEWTDKNVKYVKVIGDFDKKFKPYYKGVGSPVLPEDDIKYGVYGSNQFFVLKENKKDDYDLWLELIYLDDEVAKGEISETFVGGTKEFEANGMKGVCVDYSAIDGCQDEGEPVCHQLYLFHEEYGYFITIFASENVSEKELVNLAKTIKLEPVNHKYEASDYTRYSRSKYKTVDPNAIDDFDYYHERVMHEDSFFSGNQVKIGEATVCVKNVEVLDAVTGLDQEHFNVGFRYQYYKKFTDKNGKVKSYNRETFNPMNFEILENKTIHPKYVKVTYEVDNSQALTFDGTYFFAFGLTKYDIEDGVKYQRKDGYEGCKYLPTNELVRGDGCMYCDELEQMKGEPEGMRAIKATKGKLTLHCIYCVDDDFLDKMAVDLRYNGPYIDISQK